MILPGVDSSWKRARRQCATTQRPFPSTGSGVIQMHSRGILSGPGNCLTMAIGLIAGNTTCFSLTPLCLRPTEPAAAQEVSLHPVVAYVRLLQRGLQPVDLLADPSALLRPPGWRVPSPFRSHPRSSVTPILPGHRHGEITNLVGKGRRTFWMDLDRTACVGYGS